MLSQHSAGVGSRLLLQARVVVGVVIVKAERADRRDLSNIFPRLRPMEVLGFTRQNDDAARRISLHIVAVELLAEPDIEHTRHDGVDTVLGACVALALYHRAPSP